MKTLALLNPRRRKRRVKARRTTRRHVRRNPKRRVAATIRLRGKKRRVARILVRRNPKRRYAAVIRLRGKKRRSARILVRRNPRRRSGGGSLLSRGSGLLSQITGVFNKENLQIVGGGLAATVVVAQITERYGDKLPLYFKKDSTGKVSGVNPLGVVLYNVGLPLVAAFLVRKSAPNIAKGMVFGGLFSGALEAFKSFAPDAYKAAYYPVSGAGAYLGVGLGNTTGEYLDKQTMSVGAFAPSYQASSQFARIRPVNGALDNNAAFRKSAF